MEVKQILRCAQNGIVILKSVRICFYNERLQPPLLIRWSETIERNDRLYITVHGSTKAHHERWCIITN
jgi:hypothetical protein